MCNTAKVKFIYLTIPKIEPEIQIQVEAYAPTRHFKLLQSLSIEAYCGVSSTVGNRDGTGKNVT